MSHHRLFLASLLSSTLIFAGACRDDHGDTTSKPTSDTSAATTDVGVAITDDGVATTDNGVAVTALSAAPSPPASTPQPLRLYDYGFDMPDQINGQLVDLEVVNDGAVAHEFAVAQITPGTTAEQVIAALQTAETIPDFILNDPGGVNLLGPGETLRYQRVLPPGTYILFCPFPDPGGASSHAEHGMARVFEVTDTNHDAVPDADATIALTDDAINAPELAAGTRSYAITNQGSVSHEVYITGVPTDALTTVTSAELGEQVAAWIEGGQEGPAPHSVHFPGGHQSIPPGETVILTMTLRPAHTYQFDDYSGDQQITAQAATP